MVRDSFANHFVSGLPGIHLHLADRVPENLEPLRWRRFNSGDSTLKIDVHFFLSLKTQYLRYEHEDGNQGKSLQGCYNWTGELPFSTPGVLLGLVYHCYFGRMDHSVEHEGEANEALGPVNSVAVKVILDNRSAFKGFLRRHLSSESEAEDLLQQSLLKAIRNADELVDNEKVTAWFYRILRNSLTDFYRSRAADGRRNDGLLQELVASPVL